MTTATPDKLFCSAKRKDGGECHGWPDSSGLCPAHRPNAAEYRALGGRNRSLAHQLEKRLPTSLRPVLDLLVGALDETHKGKLAPSQASALASLASAICRCMEMGTFEQRIVALEDRMAKEHANGKRH